MIYEMRTYDIKPGSVRDAEKRFGDAYEARKEHSELVAFWHTALGPLNQLVYVWKYESLGDRARVRAAAGKNANWPPGLAQFSAMQRSEILIPAPGSPELRPAKIGPVFEMRTCTVAPGGMPLVMKNFERALPKRNALKPACAMWYTDVGALDKWIVVWPYESLEQRDQILDQARATGDWPPSVLARREGRPASPYTSRENKILMPAAFSPVQ
jgi:hypothetical protein